MSDSFIILSCPFCRTEYNANAESYALAHLMVCEKHPLRKAEADILKLRTALANLVQFAEEKRWHVDEANAALRETVPTR